MTVHNNFSVLYAEDDDLTRSKFVKILKLYFKEVYEASNGEEVLQIYSQNKVNVIILDINMPKINGIKAAQKIRESDPDVKLLFLTAYSEKEKLLDAIELRAIKYLIKPIKSLELDKLLKSLVEELTQERGNKELLYLDGGFYWDKNLQQLYDKEGIEIKLTKNENLLLKLFCDNKQKIFSNDEILEYIWDDTLIETNTNKLRTLFSKLKSKLSFNLFSSHYNLGYKINYKKN